MIFHYLPKGIKGGIMLLNKTLIFLTASVPAVAMALPVQVSNTWEVTWATDIQDIAVSELEYQLLIRSNGDGKIYLADMNDCSYEGEIDLPEGIDGFGLAFDEERYFVGSGQGLIYHSDGSDSWSSYTGPAGTAGAGMDFNHPGPEESDLYQAVTTSPHMFYSIDKEDHTWEPYDLVGLTGEISGFTAHEVATLGGYPPFAVIVTTRFTHQFYFLWESGPDYQIYAQEDCPIAIEESLGIVACWSSGRVYWSWKGTDGKYYISELWIPVFGGIEEETQGMGPGTALSVAANPSRGSTVIRTSSQAGETPRVFDLQGRRMTGLSQANNGSFNFQGPPGVYTVRLNDEALRFVITD